MKFRWSTLYLAIAWGFLIGSNFDWKGSLRFSVILLGIGLAVDLLIWWKATRDETDTF